MLWTKQMKTRGRLNLADDEIATEAQRNIDVGNQFHKCDLVAEISDIGSTRNPSLDDTFDALRESCELDAGGKDCKQS